jgi:hypothetical protein
VRGGVTQRLSNAFQYTVDIFQNISVPEAHHFAAFFCDYPGTMLIVCNTLSVLSAVQFDDQSERRTVKIDDETT